VGNEAGSITRLTSTMILTDSIFSTMEISFHSASRAASISFSFMFLAGLHSELTTQRQVTPKKIKKENKARRAIRWKRLVSWKALGAADARALR